GPRARQMATENTTPRWPHENAIRVLVVRVLSRPQKMVFDCVYGRPGTGRLPTAGSRRSGDYRRRATAGHYITLFGKRYSNSVRGACQWHAACVMRPMATSVLWHGTQTEALELLQALSRNCSCVITAEGVRLSTCAPHEMLSSDQRAIVGLLFARRIATRLRTEEFHPQASATELAAS